VDLARQYRRVQISDSRGWSGRLLSTTQLPDSTFREYRLCRRSDWNRGPIRTQGSPVTRIGPRDTQPTRFHGLARQITKRGASSGFQFTISVLRFGSEMGQNGPYSSVYRPSDYTRKAELSINESTCARARTQGPRRELVRLVNMLRCGCAIVDGT